MIDEPALLSKQKLPPEKLLPWLTYTGIMTEKLSAITGESDLKVLRQQRIACSSWEHEMLIINEPEVISRDICISSKEIIYWYARTIIPLSTYNNHSDFFCRLTNESLGKIVFDDDRVYRQSLTFYPINNMNNEFHWFKFSNDLQQQTLWVRRSHFIMDDKTSFHLLEILLPALLRLTV